MNRSLDIRPNGRGQWYIATSTGQQISPLYTAAGTATARLPGLHRELQLRHATLRKCMSCPTMFRSTGPGHRLCKACRGQE